MSAQQIIKAILFLAIQLKRVIVALKRKHIIDAKNEALENGDQRDLEASLSANNHDGDNSVRPGEYDGMYERPAKKKP